MGRRKSSLLLSAAVVVLAAPSAFAVLPLAHLPANHAWYQTDDCSGCHIPLKAPVIRRGFPINPSAKTGYGYIGAFCMERCHLAQSGPTGDGGNLSYADTTLTVGQNIGGGAQGALVGSHGLNLYNSGNNAPAGTIVVSTLPYGSGTSSGAMECTTCHNVHADNFGDSALLQFSIDLLCAACHIDRLRTGFDNTWTAAARGPANPGSHPVGTDVRGDMDDVADSGIFVGVPNAYPGRTAFSQPYGDSTNHNLGGHLWGGVQTNANNSPVSCVSCHMAHGFQADPGDAQPTSGGNLSEDLLVVPQPAMGTAEPALHANGGTNRSSNNALCEGCHTRNGVGNNDWNPGATAFSHPADDMANSLDMGVIQAAANLAYWPFGFPAAAANIGMGTGTNRILCESCHVMHPAANRNDTRVNATEDWASVPASGTHLLRRAEAGLCGVCHINMPTGHHPVTDAAHPTPYTANFGNAALGWANTDPLTCATCHGGAGAHNWGFNHMPGLKPDWEPNNMPHPRSALVSDNGRSWYEGSAATLIPGNNSLIYANASKECDDCHTKRTAGTLSPTAHRARTGERLQNWGDGTHFLGVFSTTYLDNGLYNGAQFLAETGDWNTNTAITYYSRYAGTATNPELVCESCHGLRISTFVNGTDNTAVAHGRRLLVADYQEGVVTQNTGDRGESGLCEGCHNRIIGGTGNTHVLTGEYVDRRVRAGLASGVLSTATTNLADQSGAPNDGDYPTGMSISASVSLNCDSCHQPHDASTNAGTMILDTASSNIPMAIGITSPRSAGVNLYGAAFTRSVSADHQWARGQSAPGAKDTFCGQCHSW